MTATLAPEVSEELPLDAQPEPSDVGAGEDGPRGDAGEPGVKVPLVAAASALGTFAAAWMVTRLFHDSLLALALSGLAIALGSGLTFLALRNGKSGALQYAVLPAAIALGAVLATTAAGPGASLPTLVSDAVRGGGLLEPPIPFAPGWRFLLVLFFAFVSAGSCALAVVHARPKLALAVPLPMALAAALVQPKGAEVTASAVTVVLLVAALAVAYGADLAAEGVTGGGFEARRLMRGAALMVVAVVGLVAVAQTDFLFPETDKDEVIPPMKPPAPPPMTDRELFTVKSDFTGPWRVGVLDVYDDDAFLLPSVDPRRVVKVPSSGLLRPAPAASGETFEAEFTVVDVKGQTLVAATNPVQVKGAGGQLQYDPRTQLVKRAKDALSRGFTYTVVAAKMPDGKALAAAPAPSIEAGEFAAMPAPPPGVAALLADADAVAKNRFDRLQFVRQALYSNVIAAGGGKPVDVPPGRVDDMLAGGEATPFEISAAEVMLARWAGVPARLGFGFHGGDKRGDVVSFRPRHGAAWLEAYFEGHGWIPVIGTPPKARPSLNNEQKNEDPNIVPSDELAVSVYVAVSRPNNRLLYELVRYYAGIVVPAAAGAIALVIGFPAALKLWRSQRRRRWASGKGPRHRLVVAYAELRDRCHDLNIGEVRHTPLEFWADVEDDDEHDELAWLVSRVLWGDLGRDLRMEDVEAAEEMSVSVRKRIDREQSGLMRVLAWTSRASLRDPWTDEIPNTWVRVPLPSLAGVRPRLRRVRLPLRPVAGSAATLLAVLLLASCASPTKASTPSSYPEPLMPSRVLDRFDIERRAELESQFAKPGRTGLVREGQVFIIRDGDTIQGSIQVSVLKEDVDIRDRSVQRGIEADLGLSSAFRSYRLGTVRLRVLQGAEEQVFLWFPPERNVIELFLMRRQFDDAADAVRAIIEHQRGVST